MALETGNNISDLNTANPTTGDNASEGDNHIRLIKTALTTDFPSFVTSTTGVVATQAELSVLGSVTAGTVTASKGVVVDSSSSVDVWNVDNITIDTNTISSTDTNGNVVIAPNGTGELVVTASSILMTTGESIKDAGGDEYVEFTESTTPVNHLGIESADTGVNIKLKALGEADSGIIFENDQSEELMIMECVATPVNEITTVNAATGTAPIIRSTGEADIGIIFQNAASEPVLQTSVAGSAPVNFLQIEATDTGNPIILSNEGEVDVGFNFEAKDGEEILTLRATAAAVNNISILSQAAGAEPAISAEGGDTDIGIILAPKGAGAVDIQGAVVTSETTSLTGAGAVAITGAIHEITTDSADALTLADGVEGQHLYIVCVDQSSGDATLTPTNFAQGSTITFGDDGDSCHLLFTAGKWYMVGNQGCALA
jgi:hypothetical protein